MATKQKFEPNECPHPTVWPDGTCTECGVLATMFPGLVEDFHKMIPRPKKEVPDANRD